MAKKIGRPPEKPDPVIVEEILEALRNGMTLRAYCRQPGKPHWNTVYNWVEKDEEFAGRFAQARSQGLDAIAQDTLDIIDTFPVEALSGDGKRLDSAHVTWLRNRVEQRMKLLAVWDPKRFGAKVDMTSDGKAVGLNIVIDMNDQAKS